ncbi:MAG: acyl-CoA thioesterase, partial [Flavisolibacter sp.]
MNEFNTNIQLRWSDLDPNFHVRHSVYYDWGALCRVDFLNAYGLTTNVMMQNHIGPILFREECSFRKEVKMEDKIIINLQLLKAKKDFSRWSIQHLIKKSDGTLCATIIVDGAWIDMTKRKLATVPDIVHQV